MTVIKAGDALKYSRSPTAFAALETAMTHVHGAIHRGDTSAIYYVGHLEEADRLKLIEWVSEKGYTIYQSDGCIQIDWYFAT